MPAAPTQDDRIMAALAHASAILPFMGIIAPIIIWATQKDKSRYVAFQALQALVWQLTMVVAFFLAMACYMCSFFSIFLTIPFARTTSNSAEPSGLFFAPIVFSFLIFGSIFLGGTLFNIYAIVAAVLTLQGRNFRYIIIGSWLERYLQQPNPSA
jgi:hypothetical protein